MQPLEQQRAPVRVGAQQPHGAVAVPVLEREVLVLGLVVRRSASFSTAGVPSAVRTGSTSEQYPCQSGPVGVSAHSSEHARPRGRAGGPASGPTRARGRAAPPARRGRDRKRGIGAMPYFLAFSPGAAALESAAMKASWGTSTRPTIFIRFLPSFCFSSSLRLRVMSPP